MKIEIETVWSSNVIGVQTVRGYNIRYETQTDDVDHPSHGAFWSESVPDTIDYVTAIVVLGLQRSRTR